MNFTAKDRTVILYKYMSYNALSSCLKYRTLRFSRPASFNDPFDCLASSSDVLIGNGPIYNYRPYERNIYTARSMVGVLSLTRDPLNLLMWAHYGQNHTGGVIAIDTDLAGLGCEESNLVPCHRGSVIYSSIRPEINGSPEHLPRFESIEDTDFLQKLFLYKSLHWSYEEEVRVMKLINHGEYHPHYDHVIPASAIKGVYLGVNCFHNLKDDSGAINHKRNHDFVINLPEFAYFDMFLHREKWELIPQIHEPF